MRRCHAARSCCPATWPRWPRGVRGIDRFLGAARAFLARWPDPQAWAEQPLPVRLSAGSSVRPLLNYLMLAGYLRPGYDYLLERKLPAILREATASPLAGDVTRFLSAATELGYTPQSRGGAGQPGRGAHADPDRPPAQRARRHRFAEFDAAITAREQAHGRSSSTTAPR